ncbi:MAG: tail fiber domain-containing protein [Bacteroidia bacterium]
MAKLFTWFMFMLFTWSISTFTATAQNVGIGNTSPKEKLHVSGKVKVDHALVVTPVQKSASNYISISSNVGVLIILWEPYSQANIINITGSPAEGQILTIINRDDNDAQLNSQRILSGETAQFIYGQSAWQQVSKVANIQDIDKDTKLQFDKVNDDDVIRLYIEGAERWNFVEKRIEPINSNFNLFIGKSAGKTITTGKYNTFLGNTVGEANTAGNANTAVGYGSLSDNTIGQNNASVGYLSLTKNITGTQNSALGSFSLNNNTASNNSAFGFSSLKNNSSGTQNSAFGSGSLSNNTSGNSNSAFGFESLENNITGSTNSAFGHSSLNSNTRGNGNSAFGNNSLNKNTTGNANSAFGLKSLENNTIGYSNAAFGYESLQSNLSGNRNAAFGYFSLRRNTTGKENSAFGYTSLERNTTGERNVAFGRSALLNNTTGKSNSAIGYNAMNANTTGNENIAIGSRSMQSKTSGNANIAIGYEALFLNTVGSGNIAIGYKAGRSETGSNKLFIGNSASGPALITGDFSSQVLEINGQLCPGDDNTRKLGSATKRWSAVYAANGFIQTSDARFKKQIIDIDYGLKELMQLRSVSYQWEEDSLGDTKLGFIAQELELVVPEVVSVANDSLQTRGVNYAELVPVLVKAIQEQQNIIENLEEEVAVLEDDKSNLNAKVEANAKELQLIKNYLEGLVEAE